MQNLAGIATCDEVIRRELERARVPVETCERVRGEVAYSVLGRLGDFTFRRAWYYYIVDGPVPIEVAREIYADPVGRDDVRAGGDCGCISPDDYASEWYDERGVRLLDMEERKKLEDYVANEVGKLKEIAEEMLRTHRFVESPVAVGRGVIRTYHVDSEVGLRLLADKLRGLMKEVKP